MLLSVKSKLLTILLHIWVLYHFHSPKNTITLNVSSWIYTLSFFHALILFGEVMSNYNSLSLFNYVNIKLDYRRWCNKCSWTQNLANSFFFMLKFLYIISHSIETIIYANSRFITYLNAYTCIVYYYAHKISSRLLYGLEKCI